MKMSRQYYDNIKYAILLNSIILEQCENDNNVNIDDIEQYASSLYQFIENSKLLELINNNLNKIKM